MKKIVAMVSEDVLEGVVELLVAQGIDGMTVMRTSGDGRVGIAGEAPVRMPAAERVRIEIVVESHRADRVIESVEAILESSPEIGGLMIEEVEAVVHIRSGSVLT